MSPNIRDCPKLAIQSGGRLPLPIPCIIAMMSATNAQANVITGITRRSLLQLQMVSRLGIAGSSLNNRIPPEKRHYRNVWSVFKLQAKNDQWQLVCGNVFGLPWSHRLRAMMDIRTL